MIPPSSPPQHHRLQPCTAPDHTKLNTYTKIHVNIFKSKYNKIAKLRGCVSGVSFRWKKLGLIYLTKLWTSMSTTMSVTMSATTTSSQRFVRAQRRWHNGNPKVWQTNELTDRRTGWGARDTCVSEKHDAQIEADGRVIENISWAIRQADMDSFILVRADQASFWSWFKVVKMSPDVF